MRLGFTSPVHLTLRIIESGQQIIPTMLLQDPKSELLLSDTKDSILNFYK
jgi:hypothetical protein